MSFDVRKKLYYENLFIRYKNNIRGTWNSITHLISNKVPRNSVNHIIWNSNEYCDGTKITEFFNKYF